MEAENTFNVFPIIAEVARLLENMVRSIIVDPALKSEIGHHLSLSIELSKAAKSVGHDPIWLGHKNLASDLVPDFVRFVPAFSSSIYEHQIGLFGRMLRPLVGDRRYLRSTFAESAWEIRLRQRLPTMFLDGDRTRELITALNAIKIRNDDHLIVHSADSQTLDMLNTWVARQMRGDLPAIHVRTCWLGANMPFADYCGGFSLGLRRLSSMARVLAIFAETPVGTERLANEAGLNIGVSPYLVDEATLNLPLRKSSTVTFARCET